MKLALFSDVHGNLTALEAVLADIASYSGGGYGNRNRIPGYSAK